MRCLRKPDGKQYGCWRDCCASTSEESAPPAAERRQAMSDKIKPHHLERKAILYIRQSSAYQVSHNLESQKLQYATFPPPAVHPAGAVTANHDPTKQVRYR